VHLVKVETLAEIYYTCQGRSLRWRLGLRKSFVNTLIESQLPILLPNVSDFQAYDRIAFVCTFISK